MTPFQNKRKKSIEIINSVYPDKDCSNLEQKELNKLSEKAQWIIRKNKREQRNFYRVI